VEAAGADFVLSPRISKVGSVARTRNWSRAPLRRRGDHRPTRRLRADLTMLLAASAQPGLAAKLGVSI
jgi:hypothetical protein